MIELSIALDSPQAAFLPGERITGSISWQLQKPTPAVELRLFWYTIGKGTQDLTIVDTVRIENPAISDQRRFELALPMEPYSFTGKLVSIQWALELLPESGRTADRIDIIVAPGRQPITLPQP